MMIVSKANAARLIFSATLMLQVPVAVSAGEFVVKLTNGKLADYGATPWYTDAVKYGISDMNVTFDTGTNLFWATTDDCTSVACSAHARVSTSQSEFSFIADPAYPKSVSFGPWGSMEVGLATVPIMIQTDGNPVKLDINFEASLDYTGSKFQYLAWGGGVGLPSESSAVQPHISDFFLMIFNQANLPDPTVSFEMNTSTNKGTVTFGGVGPNAATNAYVVLPAKKSTGAGLEYLWGTNLVNAKLGSTDFPRLKDGMLYLDTGSSRFKGGRKYIEPILNELLAIKDSSGNSIFEPFTDDPQSQFTGLKYSGGKSPADYPGLLPDFSIVVGSDCNNGQGSSSTIVMGPKNYSYKVDVGDRAGEWVIAFHILEGVDGLLAGSTLLNGFSTSFSYDVGPGSPATSYSQGEMRLYVNKDATAPRTWKKFNCNPY